MPAEHGSDSISRRIGEPWPASWPQITSGAVSAWASKWTMPMLPGWRTSATAEALGQVIEWSPPRTIGIAPVLADLADLAVDHRVAALGLGRDDVGVTRIDDGQLVERADVELQRVQPAGGVLGFADGPRPESRSRTVGDHVVERRAHDRDVDAARGDLGRIFHPRQVGERVGPT